jgi:hypothetical protein
MPYENKPYLLYTYKRGRTMTFSERMKELLDQGVAASKEFALKAGAKAQDLGERGILVLEVKQLEGQAQKLLSQLGNEAYQAFAERNQETLQRNIPEVESILAEITKVRDMIEQKETELRNRRS